MQLPPLERRGTFSALLFKNRLVLEDRTKRLLPLTASRPSSLLIPVRFEKIKPFLFFHP